jgi:hypothetical protein
MSGVNLKELAQKLYATCKEESVRFPKVWEESQTRTACGSELMLHRTEMGYDLDAAVDALIEKFGVEKSDPAPAPITGKKTKKEAKVKESKDDDEEDEEQETKKKAKKSDTMAVEENRTVAEAIKEMADLYFRNKDNQKGGVFSKAAKAIREADFHIVDKKGAMSLKGVGKGIAGYIEELQETNVIVKLEELRAGTA